MSQIWSYYCAPGSSEKGGAAAQGNIAVLRVQVRDEAQDQS